MSLMEETKHLRIPFEDIQLATKNFTTIIGKGGYGQVYKGELSISGKLTTVAVKRLDNNISGQGFKEFLTEIQLLSRYKHPNLISLLGFCEEGKEKVLIYEHAEHGSLDRYLSSTKSTTSLTWKQRIKICIDAARGLDYLHNHVAENHRVIHRDIKSANVLLDENWKAMIADLGLSKIGLANENDSYLITNASGTHGYCDPTYISSGILTKESDVYSFGVVLFEVLCGRLCFINVNNEHRFLAHLAQRYYKEGKLDLIIDPNLKDHMCSDSIKDFSDIAYQCLLDDRKQRPSMGLVLQKLEKALDFQVYAEMDLFTEYGEGSRYKLEKVIGKGSSGIVCSAYDTYLGKKVAIKKISDILEDLSVATSVLREIKLLRLLRYPNIVEIDNILLPLSIREFKDIYLVFELMESDLHTVIVANDDLTSEHQRFLLYQLLRGLKYIHTAHVFHRDLKPKNILVNADCKLKFCDFGIAKVAFKDTPTETFWTDYVGSRWYRAPELCGSFFSEYTPAIDIWSIGCIFAELLSGKPLFPGENVMHQLDLITDLLGTPSSATISTISNEKSRRYLSSMRRKSSIPLSQKFPNADPLALHLLERMIAFSPKHRPTAEEALGDPYFNNLAKVERGLSAEPIKASEFEFQKRKITKEEVRELIYREILNYHPIKLKEYLVGAESTSYINRSADDQFKRHFDHLEKHYLQGAVAAPPQTQRSSSLPRTRAQHPIDKEIIN